MFSMSNKSNNKLRIEVLVTKPKPNWHFLTKTAFMYVLNKPIMVYFAVQVQCTLNRSGIGIFFFHMIFINNITTNLYCKFLIQT